MKDLVTEQLREMIHQYAPSARETDRAEALTCTLSYQSITHPERHIWIDTDLGGPGIEPGGIGMDLEDWTALGEWDNAVARVRVDTVQEASMLVELWLGGGNLEGYTNVSKEYTTVQRTGQWSRDAQQSAWVPFDGGQSIGQEGSEHGIIVRDEEHDDGARITLERDGYAPYAITCGIYGWMCHTCFFSTEPSAQQAFEAMKHGLSDILALIPAEADEQADQKASVVIDAISRFVDAFP